MGTTLVAGAALATSAQQARPQPASKRTIFDAQVHFWKANSPDWPWDPGVRPQLPEPFTIERALSMMDEAGVDRVVIVPWSLNDRNDCALEAAERYPNRFGVMGRARLQDPKSAALLPTWKQQPGRALERSTRPRHSPGSPTAPPIGSGRPPRRLGLPSCFLRSANFPGSPASRSATRNLRSSSTTWA
jgi:hypothetical protein